MGSDSEDRDRRPVMPSGCRWCGVDLRDHFQRWAPEVGWHQWTEPTAQQRKERILARHRRVKKSRKSDTQALASGLLSASLQIFPGVV